MNSDFKPINFGRKEVYIIEIHDFTDDTWFPVLHRYFSTKGDAINRTRRYKNGGFRIIEYIRKETETKEDIKDDKS
jgi:hypothetical protein